jgi:8-oxo-dGTP pyrophosphatase MutT (NUDIX family)
MDDKTLFLNQVKESLIPLDELKEIKLEGHRPAAVLLPLFQEAGEWSLLFIHRAHNGEFHRGEVAFPGGGAEVEDHDLVATALRETREELGIPAERVNVLGFLNSLATVSRYIVTPIVGYIESPINLTIETSEVLRAFSIPLDWLSDPANWHHNEVDILNRGKVSTVVYNEFDHEILWGLSAKITQSFIERINKRGHR